MNKQMSYGKNMEIGIRIPMACGSDIFLMKDILNE